MRIVNFLGGLGNQMFIYVLYKHLTTIYPDEHIYGYFKSGSLNKHCGLELEKVFRLSLPSSNMLCDTISRAYIVAKRWGLTRWENDRHFTSLDIVFDGYWLDKYYQQGIPPLREVFTFRENISESTRNMLSEIERTPYSVAVHIRRGDYQSEEFIEQFGRFCTKSYYQRAISLIRENHGPDARLFFFSDDIDWVKRELSYDNAEYVDINHGDDSWQDMFLMSRCSANIIANSTFSYWAAMLNIHDDAPVVYPKRWYIWDNPDIFPDHWTTL